MQWLNNKQTVIPCKPCYIHSLAMTEKYVVFIRNPIYANTQNMTKPMSEVLEFEEDSPTSFFVLDKDDGSL